MSAIIQETRRSSRLAAKPSVDYTTVQIISEPAAKPRKVRKFVQPPPPKPFVPSAAFMEIYPSILKDSISIRRALGIARKREDFDAAVKMCDSLFNIVNPIIEHIDVLFLCDCERWAREAKLGAIEHHYAIDSIKTFISSIIWMHGRGIQAQAASA
jgi:hypothetical protein